MITHLFCCRKKKKTQTNVVYYTNRSLYSLNYQPLFGRCRALNVRRLKMKLLSECLQQMSERQRTNIIVLCHIKKKTPTCSILSEAKYLQFPVVAFHLWFYWNVWTPLSLKHLWCAHVFDMTRGGGQATMGLRVFERHLANTAVSFEGSTLLVWLAALVRDLV